MSFWDNIVEGATRGINAGRPRDEKAASGQPRDAGVLAAPPRTDLPTPLQATAGGVLGGGGRAGIYGISAEVSSSPIIARVNAGPTPGLIGGNGASVTGTTTIGQYLDALYKSANTQSITKLQKQLRSTGYLSKKYSPGKLDSATLGGLTDALVTASQASVDGRTTIDDILNGTSSYGNAAGGVAAETPFTGTKTTKTIALSTEGRARGNLEAAMQELLGRRPNKSEVAKFHKVLNAEERKSPAVTKTKYDEGEAVSSVTSGGFDAADEAATAQDDVFDQNGDEYAGVKTNSLTDAFERLIFGN